MSLKGNIADIENILAVLEQQANSTGNSWNDKVKNKFYEQFLESLPQDVVRYLRNLNELDKLIEQTENTINNL